VGQQTQGPGSHNASVDQGKKDGLDALNLLGDEGFEAGWTVYLDLENGLPFPRNLQDYVESWCDTVFGGDFQAGVYCSHGFAIDVHQLVPEARLWVFNVPTTTATRVPGNSFPDPHPSGSGFNGAFIWQLGQNCNLQLAGAPIGSVTVDLDSAVNADPGRPMPVA
jgi:hypothetical protein